MMVIDEHALKKEAVLTQMLHVRYICLDLPRKDPHVGKRYPVHGASGYGELAPWYLNTVVVWTGQR